MGGEGMSKKATHISSWKEELQRRPYLVSNYEQIGHGSLLPWQLEEKNLKPSHIAVARF